MSTEPFLPYGRHLIDDDDVAAVVAALKSDAITHGPRAPAFETALAASVGAREAVACSSGTAALHLALAALDVGPGHRCVVPAVTFLSTATAALFCGAEVTFADVDPDTGLLTAETLQAAVARGGQARAVLPVHLGGRLCDMAAIAAVARHAGAVLVEDASHALGSRDSRGDYAGGCAWSEAATFSFHPVKTIACGEGGAVTLNDPARAERMRRLRNHGVTRDPALMTDAALSFDAGGAPNPWSYEQIEFGFNYRMNEMEAALGLSQLGKLAGFVARRAALAGRYDVLLAPMAPVVRPVSAADGQSPSLHLHAVRIDFEAAGVSRAELMRRMSERGIGTQVHYIPLYRQPWFRRRYGEQRLPGAEAWYAQAVALPLFPGMADADVDRVAEALRQSLA